MFLMGNRFSTWTILLLYHAVVICVKRGLALCCWKQKAPFNMLSGCQHTESCSKTCMYCSALMFPSQIFKLPMLCALIYPISYTIMDVGFLMCADNKPGSSSPLLPGGSIHDICVSGSCIYMCFLLWHSIYIKTQCNDLKISLTCFHNKIKFTQL